MSHSSLRALLLCLTVFAPSWLQAVELYASGISVPFFNDAGTLTHRMIAKHGTKSGNVQKLREIEIHYFAPQDPNAIVQKLEAEEATWDDRLQTLVGRGPILVATQENRLTGEGFDFALATSLLHIHRKFKMDNRELLLTSDRATVELIIDRKGEDLKVRDVKRCEAIGNLQIVVQPTATKTYPFDKAFSEIAIYDGVAQTVTLPKPTRALHQGQERRVNTFKLNLKDRAPKQK